LLINHSKKYNNMTIKFIQSMIALGFVLSFYGCSTPSSLPASDQLPSAGKEQTRVTDGVIYADRKYFVSLQDRLAALNAKGIAASHYSLSKATAWLEFAQEEYTDNDRSGIVERLLAQSLSLIQKLERGDKAIDKATLIVDGSKKIRSDLWSKLQSFHEHSKFDCVQGKVAQAEVQLVWAGHEQIEGGWRHSKPYIEIAEDMIAKIDAALVDCAKVSQIVEQVKPVVVAEEKIAPPTIVKEVKDVEVQRIALATDTLFKFDKATLNDLLPSAKQILETFAQDLRKHRVIEKILITGHTDRLGASPYNLKLSEARATAIAQYLVEKGFVQAMIQVAGAGESDSLVTCTGAQPTPELQHCLQPNRRVEVRVKAIK
jgi:OmpA-OmpF porin, OOP family